jgi:excisionase family DNA binding protein
MEQRLALSPRDAARLLGGISRRHIYAAIKSGELIARTVGVRSLIETDDLMVWFRSRPVTMSSKDKKEIAR